MSLHDRPTLISGCGLSFSGQTSKTWVNLWRAAGANIVDVSGPAVSNDFILNQAIFNVLESNFDCVIIQLSFLGKLDVDVSDQQRHNELVIQDPIRNFTYKGVWPSSNSDYHISKKLYNRYLQSNSIELDNIRAKLLLLNDYCKNNTIKLFVFLGYSIDGDVPYATNPSLTELFAPNANGHVPDILSQFDIADHIAHIANTNLVLPLKRLRESYEQYRL